MALAVLVALAAVDAAVARSSSRSSAFSLRWEKEALVATPPRDHHFNEKSPRFLRLSSGARRSPTQVSAQLMRFSPPEGESFTGGSVTLFLCDDANTYCEKHTVPVPESRLP